jgi:hypothetical protein
MSHIGNKLLSGFYAFPTRQGEYLAQLLKQEEGKTAWLDPTCGEGEILKQLSTHLKSDSTEIQTYGVEIDKGRALKAEQNLDHVMNCPIESMVIQNDAFGLVFLNPPYDFTIKGAEDEKAERKEFIELQRGTRYLVGNGVLCYVIPSYRFADKQIARFLATHFERSAIMRFSDEDYNDYKQCVFIGHKKTSVVKKTNEKMMEFFLNMDSEEFVLNNVTPIPEFIGEVEWVIPATNKEIKTFYSRLENKSDYYEGIRKSVGFEGFKNRTKPKELVIGGDPILPINQGQNALLLASGACNGLLGKGPTLHLVQGMEIVGKRVEVEEFESPNGSITTKTVETTTRTVSVKILTPKGRIFKLM